MSSYNIDDLNLYWEYSCGLGHGMPEDEANTCLLTSAEAETLFSNPESLIEEVVHRSRLDKSTRYVLEDMLNGTAVYKQVRTVV